MFRSRPRHEDVISGLPICQETIHPRDHTDDAPGMPPPLNVLGCSYLSRQWRSVQSDLLPDTIIKKNTNKNDYMVYDKGMIKTTSYNTQSS